MSQSMPPFRRGSRWAAGFTLVELLVVVTIIGMLAGISLAALSRAREVGREAKTKATITKLHNIIMKRYEDYRTRRLSVPARAWWSVRSTSEVRLTAVRDLMRMEMPDRETDLFTLDSNSNAIVSRRGALTFTWGKVGEPALYNTYTARTQGPWSLTDSQGKFKRVNASAELLYLIVTIGGGPDVRAQFRDDEIADTDGNGLYEFVDGWGKPIFFLRSAPGFTDSDLQPLVVSPEAPIADYLTDVDIQTRKDIAARDDHDSFDPGRVDMRDITQPISATNRPRGWRLVPLIYSAGPDGEYGLWYDDKVGRYIWNNDVYIHNCAPAGEPAAGIGQPGPDGSGNYHHYDNIHNHRIEAR